MTVFSNTNMSVEYDHYVKTGLNLSHIQVACDGSLLAIPLTKTIIGILNLEDLHSMPVELEGHRLQLTSLCFGNKGSPKLLCSSSMDHVIVWDINHAIACVQKGNKPQGVILASSLGDVRYTSISPFDTYVAICCDMDITILKRTTKSVVATLQGHQNVVTCAEFCPHYESTLVSISEDRTFKVWDVSDGSLLYQSHVITASPLISIAMDYSSPYVAIGTADGVVMMFDLTDGNRFRSLHKFDVGLALKKIKSKADAQESSSSLGDGDTIKDSAESGYTVQGLFFSHVSSPQQISQPTPSSPLVQSSNVHELLEPSPILYIGTSGDFLQVNARTMEVCDAFNFQDQFSGKIAHNSDQVVGAIGSACFAQGRDQNTIQCILGSQFQNVCHILKWKQSSLNLNIGSQVNEDALGSGNLNKLIGGLESHLQDTSLTSSSDSDSNQFNVVSNVPLTADTVLRIEKSTPTKDSSKGKDVKKKVQTTNKPLTFHSKVKSSGYTEAPRRTMFQPKTDFSKNSTGKGKTSKMERMVSDAMKQYSVPEEPPSILQSSIDVADKPTPINTIKFSGDGQNVATALSSQVAVSYKFPWKERHVGSCYINHNHIVNDIDWSNDGNFLISASDDKTAAVWKKNITDPVMVLDTVKANVVTMEGQPKDAENVKFHKEMKFARFYYLDNFLLLASGNSIYLYKYHLDTEKNDIKRYITKCRYKLRFRHETSAQQVTALSAANSFYSYLIFCGGSNKAVDILDMNCGKVIRSFEDVHARCAHVIKQNLGSSYCSLTSEAYNLFLTAAAGDCIKLWDTRMQSCLRRYEGHVSRKFPCGIDISPCGRYICTGADDRAAYLYDVRGGTYCQRLSGHTETVTDVAFHPLHQQLVTSTLDGKLHLFST